MWESPPCRCAVRCCGVLPHAVGNTGVYNNADTPQLRGQPVNERHDDLFQPLCCWCCCLGRPRGPHLGQPLQLRGTLAWARIEQDGQVFTRLFLRKPVGALQQPVNGGGVQERKDGKVATRAYRKNTW